MKNTVELTEVSRRGVQINISLTERDIFVDEKYFCSILREP